MCLSLWKSAKNVIVQYQFLTRYSGILCGLLLQKFSAKVIHIVLLCVLLEVWFCHYISLLLKMKFCNFKKSFLILLIIHIKKAAIRTLVRYPTKGGGIFSNYIDIVRKDKKRTYDVMYSKIHMFASLKQPYVYIQNV